MFSTFFATLRRRVSACLLTKQRQRSLHWWWSRYSALVRGRFAQTSDGIILGTVSDATGAVIPNASVTATNKATNVTYTKRRQRVGEYRINNVPVGSYDVDKLAGMTPQRLANVAVDVNRTSTVNLTLQVASVTADVVVQEAPPLIDSSTSQLESTFKGEQALNQAAAGNFRTIRAF